MSTGLDVFDSTVQQTNLWLKDLMERLAMSDRHLAYQLLRATLHTIRDRLPPENAVHFGAQLPMLVRGFYYEGWHMAATPGRTRHVGDFLDDIDAGTRGNLGADTERMVKAVLEVIAARIDAGEVAKLTGVLPRELRTLWPERG
jgi:uncharacterized protein (DUF2267 family)